jgi:hypothetical protein
LINNGGGSNTPTTTAGIPTINSSSASGSGSGSGSGSSNGPMLFTAVNGMLTGTSKPSTRFAAHYESSSPYTAPLLSPTTSFSSSPLLSSTSCDYIQDHSSINSNISNTDNGHRKYNNKGFTKQQL